MKQYPILTKSSFCGVLYRMKTGKLNIALKIPVMLSLSKFFLTNVILLSSCLVCSSSFMPVSFLVLKLWQVLSKGIWLEIPHPANIYKFKVIKTNRKRCEIYLKVIIVNHVKSHWCHSQSFYCWFQQVNVKKAFSILTSILELYWNWIQQLTPNLLWLLLWMPI